MVTEAHAIRPTVSSTYEGRIDPRGRRIRVGRQRSESGVSRRAGRAPLYSACLVGAAQNEAQELSGSLAAITGWLATVHGEHDMYFWAPVRPGMDLRWAAVTHSVRQKSTGVVVVQRITLTDTSGGSRTSGPNSSTGSYRATNWTPTAEIIAEQIAQAPLSVLMGIKAGVKRAWEGMGMRVYIQSHLQMMQLVGHAGDVAAWRQENQDRATDRHRAKWRPDASDGGGDRPLPYGFDRLRAAGALGRSRAI